MQPGWQVNRTPSSIEILSRDARAPDGGVAGVFNRSAVFIINKDVDDGDFVALSFEPIFDAGAHADRFAIMCGTEFAHFTRRMNPGAEIVIVDQDPVGEREQDRRMRQAIGAYGSVERRTHAR